MKHLTRGAWIAIAAALAVPTTVALAKGFHEGGWHQMTPETRARLDDGKIAGAKAALKLTPDQEKLWQPVEENLRTFFKDHEARMEERHKKFEEWEKLSKEGKEPVHPDMAQRLEKMSQRMSERAERLKTFSASFKPFYESLTDEQKQVLRIVARQFMPHMRHHHRGPHWGHGGPGPFFGHGHHGHRGPGMERGGPDHGPANAPSDDDDKGGPPAPDND